MYHLGINNMVFHRSGNGEITAGGFQINNKALSCGKSALITTGGGGKQKNTKVSDLISNYAVPSGLFYMKEHLDKNYTTINSNEVVEAELFDKLLLLANTDNKVDNKKSKKSKKAGKTKQTKVKTKKNRRR
jgi:hypothetical protein